MSGVQVVGRDHIGLIVDVNGHRHYLTDCCRASPTGVQATPDNPSGVACRSCGTPQDPRLAGKPAPTGGDPGETIAAALLQVEHRRVAAAAFERVGGVLPENTTVTQLDPAGLYLVTNTEPGAAPDNRQALIFDDFPLTRFTSGTGFMRWRAGKPDPVGYMHRGGGRSASGELADFLPPASFLRAQELARTHLTAPTTTPTEASA